VLPPFDPFAGHLPPGWHSATVDGFRQRCVDEFPPHLRHELQQPDAHRKRLFEGYLRLHGALSELSIPTEQWIGGAFVSAAEQPDAIDVINFCDAKAYESLPAELRALIKRYFDSERTARHCHCDSRMVAKGPPDHPCNADYLKMHNFWHKRLAYDRDKRPRGIIGITIEAALPEEAADAET
jgi:hypothetical protein